MAHAHGNGVCSMCLQAVLQQQLSTRHTKEQLLEAASRHGRRRGRLLRRCGQRWRLGECCFRDLVVLYELQPAG